MRLHLLPSFVSTLALLAFAPSALRSAEPPPAPITWGEPDITGARIDESAVRAEVIVDPSAPADSGVARTLAEGFARAREHLAEGTPTRLLLKAGLYRETATDLGLAEGTARDTLLVVEGEAHGRVVITGADLFPASAWQDLGDGLFVTAWPHRFGNASPDWGPPRLIGHRSEMVFLGDRPLRQIILDEYQVKGIGQSLSTLERAAKPSWTYQRTLDPRATLLAGEFGVTEHQDDGRLYVRLAPGEKIPAEGLEVSVRRNLINFGSRGNLVLRNLVFTRAANSLTGPRPVNFGNVGEFGPRDVLIERCDFLWNNSTALSLGGAGWTLRDNRFNYNGGLGITGWGASEMLWERNQTSFNGWRVWRGGEIAWFSGGVKLHYVKRHWVRGHESIANVSTGFHYDIACRDVWNEDLVLIDNAPGGLVYELGVGPFRARRVLAVGGSMNGGTTLRLWHVKNALIQDSVFYNNYAGRAWGNAEPAILADARISGRRDAHARKDPFEGSILQLERTVLALGDAQPRLLRFSDRRKPEDRSAPFRWIGEGNIYAFPGADGAERFLIPGRDGKEAPQNLAAWRSAADVTERDLAHAPRALRDPENGDYRLVSGRPFDALASRLPSRVLSAAEREARDAFFAWIGYDRVGGELSNPDSRARAKASGSSAAAPMGRIDPLD